MKADTSLWRFTRISKASSFQDRSEITWYSTRGLRYLRAHIHQQYPGLQSVTGGGPGEECVGILARVPSQR
ncbi:hypothetical protein MCOR11_008580 [Pyricularia oryzae]|nr:hypothetical protein MCOR11_008580 [Pyricularia oryzae]